MKPNSLKMRIFNLSPSHRKEFESGKNRVILQAGYTEGMTQIFNGQVRAAWSAHEGSDWVTYLDTGDSFMEVSLAGINTSMAPKSGAADFLQSVAQSFGLKGDAVNRAIAKLGSKLGGKAQALVGQRGIVRGNASKILTDICDSSGLEWTIQDGELLILQKGRPLDEGVDFGLRLSADTGLIESPSLELKSAGSFSSPVQVAKSVALSKPGHLVTATVLIHPGLKIGRKVVFDAREVKGGYRIIELEYNGKTRGKEWYCKLTGSRYDQ